MGFLALLASAFSVLEEHTKSSDYLPLPPLQNRPEYGIGEREAEALRSSALRTPLHLPLFSLSEFFLLLYHTLKATLNLCASFL
jgi:hypothetical protein